MEQQAVPCADACYSLAKERHLHTQQLFAKTANLRIKLVVFFLSPCLSSLMHCTGANCMQILFIFRFAGVSVNTILVFQRRSAAPSRCSGLAVVRVTWPTLLPGIAAGVVKAPTHPLRTSSYHRPRRPARNLS